MSIKSPLSIDVFPTWARLNDVEFINAKLQETDGKGIGLVATNDLTTIPATEAVTRAEDLEDREGQGLSTGGKEDERAMGEIQGQTNINSTRLLRIPRDLILSAAAIEEYTKVDQNFRQLLDSAGHQPALEAKFSALNKEFDELIEKSSGLAYWNSLFWEKETVTIKDWVLVDAWYRSRCLELPQAGHAMVPGLDMANHSHRPTAYYEEDGKDNIVLLARPGADISEGGEVNISYGEKPPAEMLFSYGFIDSESTIEGLTLPLELLHDDPLGKAKLHIFKGSPSLKLSRSGGDISWQCPFVYLMCLNEEDGLEFRVLQGKDGERELKLFWQEEDVTARADDFGDLIKGHPLCQVFRLRAVSVLHEVVSNHLMQLSSDISHDELEALRRTGQVKDDRLQLAGKLREIEASVLESAAVVLNEQRAHLFADDHVVAYLGSMEASQDGKVPEPAANEEDDFS
ncbi:SET domain-containing protein 8 [Fusarium austroafricanum]|uniref:SET domain-containing protein 8 n=1 Tax=Fusarium austroafricanum TaxID=2364996 RepID=A0A8H4P3B9_9HYPO|nr:SET domain-containing protein 8 [Fusarium austroafricanum]